MNRPYNDGEMYNSMMLEAEMVNTGKQHYYVNEAKVNDEAEAVKYCPLCKLSDGLGKVKIRGLCTESMFDTEYMIHLVEGGSIQFLGRYSSSITFNPTTQLWEWRDMNDNQSVATREIVITSGESNY